MVRRSRTSGGLGEVLLSDGHTVQISAYEGTWDKGAWYRKDKQPEPVFGTNAKLSAGVSVVIRDNANTHDKYKYYNRMYSDDIVEVDRKDWEALTPNPKTTQINKKLGNNKMADHVRRGVFGIESDFVEKNPKKVSQGESDWKNPIKLLTNNVAGPGGRPMWYWIDECNIPCGKDYINKYKVVTNSAYPKKTFVCSRPTIESIKNRVDEIVNIMGPQSAFGRSRLMLFSSDKESECNNFIKYCKTTFFAALMLQEPNRCSSVGFIIPYQDFSDKSDIDWSKGIEDINKQLYKKYNLTEEEINFLEGK